MSPLIWVAIGLVCAAAELFTFTLVVGPIGLAALAAGGASALGAPVAVQMVVLVVVSIIAILLLRPVARMQQNKPGHKTGVAALTGTTGRSVSEITEHSGQIRLGGDTWTARSEFEDDVIPEGARVYVTRIDGATAIVQQVD